MGSLANRPDDGLRSWHGTASRTELRILKPSSPTVKVDCFDNRSVSIALAGAYADVHAPWDGCDPIDGVLEKLAQEAATDVPARQFHDRLLAEAICASHAAGGAIWLGGERVHERMPAGWSAEQPDNAVTNGAVTHSRGQMIERALDLGQPFTSALDCPCSTLVTDQLIAAIAPVCVEKKAEGAVELLLPGAASQPERERALCLAVAFAEVLAGFHRHRRLDHYRQQERQWRDVLKLIEHIHRTGSAETAVAIANEGRWFVGCDRVSLLAARDCRCELRAVSGIDQVERRAAISRRMRELADVALKVNEPIWATSEPRGHAPQIEQPLQTFLDESHAGAVVVLPLLKTETLRAASDAPSIDLLDRQACGVLVLEWFATQQIDDATRERIDLFARHSAAALAVAQATDDLPLIRINRVLGGLRGVVEARRLPKTLWVVGSIMLLVMALVFVPADLEVAADGELLPAQRREIFAPADGVVDVVFVEHGDDVVLGQPLLRLRSPSLDLEKARLEGEIQTAEKRLAAIQAARFEKDSQAENAGLQHLRLTAEGEELKLKLQSLRQQDELLAAQHAELEICAPLAGRVLTWDAARSLKARPVNRGQPLLSIGDVAGPWQVELEVPDHHIGYVFQALAQREDQQALPVSFLLLADPKVLYPGQVERIAMRSCVDEQRGETFVRVTVRIDEPVDNPRPGAAVAGKVQCGRRSLGFVWLHDAWNSIQRRVLF